VFLTCTIGYVFIPHLSKIESACFDLYVFRKLSASVFSESLLCMFDSLVLLTGSTLYSLAQILPEWFSGYFQTVYGSLILL